MTADRKYAVEVELPAEAFRHRPWSASDVAADLRLLWLVDQVRQRRLGYAKAAELAGMPQAAFGSSQGIPYLHSIWTRTRSNGRSRPGWLSAVRDRRR